jgi:hypothetical protein
MVVTPVLLQEVILEHPVLAVTRVVTQELAPLMEVESLSVEEAPSAVPRWRPQRKVSMRRLLDPS